MIDTHSHIYLPDFDADRIELLEKAAEAGVTDICMPGIDLKSLELMESIQSSTIRLHKMVGIHPCDVENAPAQLEKFLSERGSSDDIIAIGETGLDYYWSKEFAEQQKKSLRIHCKISKELRKPIVLHNRESTGNLLDIIECEQDGTLTGVWHCFNGSVEEGHRAIELGLLLGIGGVVTFKNAGVDKTVSQLPLEKMILETDAPYLTPAPFRGKRNEPAMIRLICEKLALIFERKTVEIDDITTKNARSLFGI